MGSPGETAGAPLSNLQLVPGAWEGQYWGCRSVDIQTSFT